MSPARKASRTVTLALGCGLTCTVTLGPVVLGRPPVAQIIVRNAGGKAIEKARLPWTTAAIRADNSQARHIADRAIRAGLPTPTAGAAS